MSQLLSIEDIAPDLSYPGFWDQRRLVFLQSILEVCKYRTIRTKNLDQLGHNIEERFNSLFFMGSESSYKFDTREKKRCNEVIYFLAMNDWKCNYYEQRKKTPRPSVVPTSSEQFHLWQLAQKMLEAFWSGQFPINQQTSLIFFLLDVMSATGIAGNALNRTFSIGLDRSIDRSSRRLYIRLDPDTHHETSFPLSCRQGLLLNYLAPKTLKAQSVIQVLEGKLTSSLPQQKLDMLRSFDHYKDITISKLLNYASLQPAVTGIEPAIFSVISRDLIPVPISDVSIASRISKVIYPGRLHPSKTLADHEPSAISSNDSESKAEKNHPGLNELFDWESECRRAIRKVRFKLRRHLLDENGSFHNRPLAESLVAEQLDGLKQFTVESAFNRALDAATFEYQRDDLARQMEVLRNTTTGLDLACERIRYHLIEANNTFDTCFKEISAIFLNGFLSYEAGWNLEQWEEEDFELLTVEHVFYRPSNQEIGPSTTEQISSTLQRVIRFGRKKLGLFKRINLPHIGTRGKVFTSRNNIVSLEEFDAVLGQVQGVIRHILSLAFYTGMRSGEIINLSLADISFGADELILYVREGKTQAAKRAIPVHRLMPVRELQELVQFIKDREAKFESFMRGKSSMRGVDRARARFPLFVETEKETFTAGSTLLSDARDRLKQHLDRPADLHLLRHSFASYFYLRWYAAKHPDFLDTLVEKDHWIFSDEGVTHLKNFLGVFTSEPIPEDHSTAMIHFIKVFGHTNTSTLFQVYIHTYDFVVEHAIKKAAEKNDLLPLKGALISEFVPGMKSRSTQRNLKDRSAKALIKFSNN